MNTPVRSTLASLPLLVAAFAWASPPLCAQEQGAAANEACYRCHGADADVMAFADGAEVSIALDKRAFLESAHGRFACRTCHVGLDPMEHTFDDRGDYADYRRGLTARCVACHTGTATDVDAALRPRKVIDGTLHPTEVEGGPLCVDCHAPHAVTHGDRLRASASRSCAECHEEIYATYAASVHGAGIIDPEDRDRPACVDCHDGHGESGAIVAARNVRLGKPCMSCHGDASLMERYGLSTQVVSTYLNDFHGVSVGFYEQADDGAGLSTLVCADCHGVHDVMAMAAVDPVLMKQKLLNVCIRCHEEASESFPDAWLSHYEPSLTKAPLVFAVKLGYWIFIPFVIIGLGLQIFAHLVLFPRRKNKAADPHATADGALPTLQPGDERRMVTRFGRRHRLEHLLVMVTFVLLLATGLPQKFWDYRWASWVTAAFGGIDTMRTVHRVTGIVFSGLLVLHLALAIRGILTNRTGMTMVPGRKDFRDAVVNLKYYLGSADAPPKFDRYDYRQKFEYWGMIVGSLVMVLSGFVLYFPMLFASYLPGQLIPAAKMGHTYEAMMALLTIVVWHMYGAHLNPDCYPLDRSIFTGRISLARMKHEHAIEYEREREKLEIEEVTGRGAQVGSVDSVTEAVVPKLP